MRELGVSIILKKEKYSPMMEKYLELKKDHQDAIVMYRIGDFYEMFFDDAAIASKALNNVYQCVVYHFMLQVVM